MATVRKDVSPVLDPPTRGTRFGTSVLFTRGSCRDSSPTQNSNQERESSRSRTEWSSREPIVAVDEAAMRLVWTAEGGATHYNGSAGVRRAGRHRTRRLDGRLPPRLVDRRADGMMSAGAAAMKTALDRLRIDD